VFKIAKVTKFNGELIKVFSTKIKNTEYIVYNKILSDERNGAIKCITESKKV